MICITQPFYHKQSETQNKFLSSVQLVWIQNFLFPRIVALPRLKDPDCPKESPCRIMAKTGLWLHSEFKLQSYYYIHFQINILGKGLNYLILPLLKKAKNKPTKLTTQLFTHSWREKRWSHAFLKGISQSETNTFIKDSCCFHFLWP